MKWARELARVDSDAAWFRWLVSAPRAPTRELARACRAACELLLPLWPERLGGDERLEVSLACLRAATTCPCAMHATACFGRVGRHGVPPLDGKLLPPPLEIQGVKLDAAAESAFWAVEEALRVAAFEWRRAPGWETAGYHGERCLAGVVEALTARRTSPTEPYRLVLDAVRAELAPEIARALSEPDDEPAPPPPPAPSKPEPPRAPYVPPPRFLEEAEVRALVAEIAATFVPGVHVEERPGERYDQDWRYYVAIAWHANDLDVRWEYEVIHNFGIDRDQKLAIDVAGTHAFVSDTDITVDGPRAEALRALLAQYIEKNR